MTARSLLLRSITELSDEDVEALLGVAERLRAKHLRPQTSAANGLFAADGMRHPERFGTLSGSVRFCADVESPVMDDSEWTSDERNLGS